MSLQVKEVKVERGLARCPICGDYARMGIEAYGLVVYHQCIHFTGAWSTDRVVAIFSNEERANCACKSI